MLLSLRNREGKHSHTQSNDKINNDSMLYKVREHWKWSSLLRRFMVFLYLTMQIYNLGRWLPFRGLYREI